jgi:uncharacterized protein YbjT (DUF2867 family)
MKIVVIGGTGRIGSKVVQRLRDAGHEVVAASPQTGVDILTGAGLDAAMAGAAVVVDLANSPTFVGEAPVTFFRTAGQNLLAAEARAGVKHHLALSVVGTERLAANDYFRAKLEQERLIRESGIPYTIIHSTQFYEFLPSIIESGAQGTTVRLPSAFVQPIAAEDVAEAVARYALQPPAGGIVDIAGPERAPMHELARRFLRAVKDAREVVGDPDAPYYGGKIEPDTLVPTGQAWHGAQGFDAWFAQSDYAKQPPAAA